MKQYYHHHHQSFYQRHHPHHHFLLLLSLIPRSSIADHRIKSRAGAIDIDTNKLSTTIKRSQAISNIQDLDEDSPVTFEIEPNEHHHGRKKVQLQTNSIFNK